MIFYALSIFSIVISVLCRAQQLTLPVTTCTRNSTDYSICLKNALQEAWPRFQKGLPEFDFPRLEPFYYENGRIIIKANGIYGEANITNVTVYGSESIHFLDVKPHFLNDVFRLEIDMIIPKLFIKTYINGNANLLGIQGYGAGHINITTNNNRATLDITGHVKNDTWIAEHCDIIMTIGSFKSQFSGFFNGIKELNDIFGEFVNEYWPPIYRMSGPIIFKDLAEPLAIDLHNRLFSKVLFSKVFP